MSTVELTLPHHRYQIRIEHGLLGSLGQCVRDVAAHDRAALLCDANIQDPHGKMAMEALNDAAFDVTHISMHPGEDRKNLDTVAAVYEQMINARLERKSPCIALGGGVIGDTAGFIAATYLRGVPFIQCPTTLLAMVDASVGGKVGVNLPQGKNLIGAFYQPSLVAIDTQTLATLPARELRCGLAECVKHAIIRDPSLFDWLEANISRVLEVDQSAMVELVERNVKIKAAVVMEDEKESGVRAHLNFGHTFAHAIEATSGYGHYHHGEAVALGMVAAVQLAVSQNMVDAALLKRLTALLNAIGLPTGPVDGKALAPVDQLMDAMRLDKKVKDNHIRFILPTKMGEVVIRKDIDDAAVREAWATLFR